MINLQQVYTMGYKISRKVQFSVLKLTSHLFPQHLLPTVHYTYCHCCVHCYTLYGKIRTVWTESKKTCLRFFFKFGPKWPKRTHYKLFMSTDDKYTSISKSVLIENYGLIKYPCPNGLVVKPLLIARLGVRYPAEAFSFSFL